MANIAVILGAGASFDVADSSVPLLDPNLKPPLAKDLFGMRPKFFEIVEGYPRVRSAWAELAAHTESGESIEEKLREYAEHSDERIREIFKEIPLYLRDLLQRVSAEYIRYPAVHSRFVLQLFSTGHHRFCFVSLNYDTFLEQALEGFDRSFKFNHIQHYVKDGRQASVFKIHGSVNWGIPMNSQNDPKQWGSAYEEFRPGLTAIREIIVSDARGRSIGWDYDGRYLYPALTAPVAGKSKDSILLIQAHEDSLLRMLSTCNAVLVIGTSGLDDDLMEILRRGLAQGADSIPCYVVGFGDSAATGAERFRKGVGQPSIVGSNPQGFRAWVESGGAARFATAHAAPGLRP